MDDDALVENAWNAFVRLSNGAAAPNEDIFRQAVRQALAESDIAEFVQFLRRLDRKAEERRNRVAIEMLGQLDSEERTADW